MPSRLRSAGEIDAERLEHERGLAVQGLRELEFDREMGKLSDADYETLRAGLENRALVAMQSTRAARGQSRARSGACGETGPAGRARAPRRAHARRAIPELWRNAYKRRRAARGPVLFPMRKQDDRRRALLRRMRLRCDPPDAPPAGTTDGRADCRDTRARQELRPRSRPARSQSARGIRPRRRDYRRQRRG